MGCMGGWVYFNHWLIGFVLVCPRWPQEISGTRKGDVILLATAKWLVDVRGVQVVNVIFIIFAQILLRYG